MNRFLERRLLQKLMLALGSIVVLVVVVEGGARLFFSEGQVLPPAVPRHVGRFDPHLGWALEPNSSGVSDTTGYSIEYRINSKGLRDDETTYEKPEGVFRIVLIGDSSTFGFGVPVEKDFATILEGYFRDVEVINMGVSGFGIDQELLFLEEEGFRYHPDLVIALVEHYGSQRHLFTVRFGKRKPRFVLDEEGKLSLTNTPVENKPAVERSLLAGLAADTGQWLLEHSKAYRLFLGFIAAMRPKATRKASAGPDLERRRAEYQPPWSAKELLELGDAIIRRMHDSSREHGAEFLLVTRMQKVHLAARKNDIISVNVSRAMSNPAFTIPRLLHFNESGHGVLAWEIARYLEQRDLIPQAHRLAAPRK